MLYFQIFIMSITATMVGGKDGPEDDGGGFEPGIANDNAKGNSLCQASSQRNQCLAVDICIILILMYVLNHFNKYLVKHMKNQVNGMETINRQ